jgi:hypothetical protein
MNVERIVLVANWVEPKIRMSWRSQSTSYTSDVAPDSTKSRKIAV